MANWVKMALALFAKNEQSGATEQVEMTREARLKVAVDGRDIFGNLTISRRENQVEVPFDDTNWANFVDNTGSGSAPAASQASGQITVSSGTGANAARELRSKDFVKYRPGSEVGWGGTWKVGSIAGAPSSYVRAGASDANWQNGVWIGTENQVFGLTYCRGGSIIWTKTQAQWLDPCDGTAGSNYTLNGSPVAMDPTQDQLIRIRAGLFGHAGFVVELRTPDQTWVTIYEHTAINTDTVPVFANFDLNIAIAVSKTASDATNLSATSACWAGWTGSGKGRLSVLPTSRSLAELVQAVLVGKTNSGAYAQLLVNNQGRLQLESSVVNINGDQINPATEDSLLKRNNAFATLLNAQADITEKIVLIEEDGANAEMAYNCRAPTATAVDAASWEVLRIRRIGKEGDQAALAYTRSGTTVTVAQASHTLLVGDLVYIKSATDSLLDGHQKVTAVASGTWSFEAATGSTPGTLTVKAGYSELRYRTGVALTSLESGW